MKATIKISDDKFGVVKQVEAFIPVWEQFKDGKFIVRCPLLKTYGYSDVSFEAAHADHKADLDAFFNLHSAQHSLHQALKTLGWTKQESAKSFNPPVIPEYLLRTAKQQSQTINIAA